jgi:hypothetical protein
MIRLGAQFAVVVILFGALCAREFQVAPFAGIEEGWRDLLSRRQSAPASVAPITQVDIDEAAIEELGWPWSPLDFAVFLQATIPLDTPVVATEPAFDFPADRMKPEVRDRLAQYRSMLLDQVHRTPRLVLGARLGFPDDFQVVPPLEAVPVLRRFSGSILEVPEYTALESWSSEEYRLSTQPGFSNIPENPSLPTSAPMVLRYRGQLVPTLPLQVLMIMQRALPDDVEVAIGNYVQVGPRMRLPINASGRMPVNFAVGCQRVPYLEFLRMRAEQKPDPKSSGYRRPILLVRTDASSRTLKWPGREAISPGHLMATAVATARLGAFRQPTPPWVPWAIIACGAVGAFWLPAVQWRFVAIGALAFILLWVVAGLVVAITLDSILPIMLPVGLALFIVLWRATLPNRVRQVSAMKPLEFSDSA